MRKVTAIMAAAVVVLLLAAGCGDGEEEGITVEDLTGVWKGLECGCYLQLNADETYRIALSADDLESTTVEAGRFRLEGALFTFISSEASINCTAGDRGTYEIELIEEDRLRQVLQEDQCATRRLLTVHLERIQGAPR
ncbi:MAG: hypothetical protein ACE5JL_16525 [Dehalococcoidia bacterium]